MLSGYRLTRNSEAAVALLDQLETAGLALASPAAYNAAMRACGQTGQWNRADALLHELIDREGAANVTPSHFESAIVACGHARQWQRAVALLDEMKRLPGGPRPTLVTLNTVLEACASAVSRSKDASDRSESFDSGVTGGGGVAGIQIAAVDGRDATTSESCRGRPFRFWRALDASPCYAPHI